jgi:hypothetical protein
VLGDLYRLLAPRRLGVAVSTAVVVALLTPAAATAQTITVGSSLLNQYTVPVTFLLPSLTVGNTALSDPEATATSPVDGVILRWRLTAQSAADSFALRVLHPTGTGSYTGAGTSVSRVASTTATETFATDLPIQAGDAIGLDSLKNTPVVKAASIASAKAEYWSASLGEGVTAAPTPLSGFEFGFNADVQPAPRVVLVSPSSGPVGGGTKVTIAGSDFAGVKEVKFGSIPATSFTVESEAEITAVAPAAASAGPVDVSVTTVAGASPSASGDRFTYEAAPAPAPAPLPAAPAPTCRVPKLAGKKLKGARKALAQANCKLGKVTRARRKATKVAGQSPKAGTAKPAGSSVNVSLG